MKKIIATAAWLGIVTYCLLSTLVGPIGIKAMRRATEASEAMYRNLDELKAKNESLSTELGALNSSPESIALEARSLGYLEQDEVAVRLRLGAATESPPDPGRRLSFEPTAPCADTVAKSVSLSVALIYALAATLTARLGRSEAYRERRVHEAART